MIKKILKYAVISLVLLFMYVPILVLAVYSFTDASNIGAIHAFSFQNYVTLFTTPELQHMIFGSILLAFGSAANCNNTWNYRMLLVLFIQKRE